MARALSPLTIVAFVCHLGLAALCAAQEDAAPDDPLHYAGPPRKGDEVFLFDTRAIAQPKTAALDRLDLQRWSENDKWEPLSLEAFLADDADGATTLIYVHGYSFDEEKARRVGWALYHALCDDLPAENRVRYIVWSWPSEAKRFRPTRDVAAKGVRADGDAVCLARLLAKWPGDGSVHLIASSLGCRVAEGTLHLGGGGAIDGQTIDRRPRDKRPQVFTAFISPAVHNDWLYEGQFHDKALAGAARLLLIHNADDPTLSRYSQVWRDRPQALGLTGLAAPSKLSGGAEKIQQYDAREMIGENHGVENYLRSAAIVKRLQAFLLDD